MASPGSGVPQYPPLWFYSFFVTGHSSKILLQAPYLQPPPDLRSFTFLICRSQQYLEVRSDSGVSTRAKILSGPISTIPTENDVL